MELPFFLICKKYIDMRNQYLFNWYSDDKDLKKNIYSLMYIQNDATARTLSITVWYYMQQSTSSEASFVKNEFLELL